MASTAIGFLEVQGYSVALAAMDQACKAADVRIQGIDSNNPDPQKKLTIPVMVQVKMTGTVSDVKHALEVARETARRYLSDEDILTHMISRGEDGTDALLGIGKVARK